MIVSWLCWEARITLSSLIAKELADTDPFSRDIVSWRVALRFLPMAASAFLQNPDADKDMIRMLRYATQTWGMLSAKVAPSTTLQRMKAIPADFQIGSDLRIVCGLFESAFSFTATTNVATREIEDMDRFFRIAERTAVGSNSTGGKKVLDDIVKEIEKDRRHLKTHAREASITAPLWTEGRPEWFTWDIDKPLRSWSTWSAWFDSRIHGIPTSYPGARSKEVDISLARASDQFWMGPSAEIVSRVSKVIGGLPDDLPDDLPPQEHGVRFEVVEAGIDLATVSRSTNFGDVRRLEIYRPLVLSALDEFLEATPELDGKSNDPFRRCRQQAVLYRQHADINVEFGLMDFDLLFGIGTMLQNRLSVDMEKSSESDLPPLSDRQRNALQDFQDSHGLFITASIAGLEAITQADRMARNPAQERKLSHDVVSLAAIAQRGENIVTNNAADLIRSAAEEIGRGHQAERATRFGIGTARNFIIVLSAGAAVATITMVGSTGGPVGIALSAPFSLWVLEATKRTQAFKGMTEPLAEFMDADKAAKYVRFVLENEEIMLRIAGDRPEFKWLREHIKWLKSHDAGLIAIAADVKSTDA